MRPPAYNAEQVQQEQGERNVAMAVCVQLAGRAIIRVVSRCEEAQDNCNLGRPDLCDLWSRIVYLSDPREMLDSNSTLR